jgi:RND family efflux transporter MFP subunit
MKYLILAIVIISSLIFWVYQGLAQQDDHSHGDDSHSHQADDQHQDHQASGTDDSSADEPPSVAVTQWTSKMELFMEYPVLVTGISGKFIIHLTTLDDFQPVRSGSVKLGFTHESGKEYEVSKDELLREGIFTPIIELPQAGNYRFILSYYGQRVQESFEIDNFQVYNDASQIPTTDDEGDEEISFLKEQQWKIDFRTEPVQRRSIRSSVRAVATVLPRHEGYAELVSPVVGIVDIENNSLLVIPGIEVEKGQTLAVIAPTLRGADGWTDLKLSYEQSKRNYERMKRMLSRNAVSQKSFEEAEQDYLVKKSSYESFAGATDTDKFHVRAPINGYVTEMDILPGQKIEIGQKLMTIVNPSTVWLQVNVFEADYYGMTEPTGIYLTVPGRDGAISIDQNNMRLLSIGSAIDKDNRTIPVLVEVSNPDLLLKINQSVDAELYFGSTELALCIPRSAIFDEDAQDVVYVHSEGESFVKRVVTIGAHDDGWVSVPSGLQEGERVVTRGGYMVKLASTTAEIGHGHAH